MCAPASAPVKRPPDAPAVRSPNGFRFFSFLSPDPGRRGESPQAGAQRHRSLQRTVKLVPLLRPRPEDRGRGGCPQPNREHRMKSLDFKHQNLYRAKQSKNPKCLKRSPMVLTKFKIEVPHNLQQLSQNLFFLS